MWHLLLCTLVVTAHAQFVQPQCSNKETCGACIQTPGCAWCSQAGNMSIRCIPSATLQERPNICPPNSVVNPQPQVQVLTDLPLYAGGKQGGQVRDSVQIRPQHIKVKVRPGVPVRIPLQYAQAEDYPVDLYYVMDLSLSMLDDKEKLSSLGKKLAEAMQILTSNFKLGFGSFVDKREMPFVNTVPKRLKEPCDRCTSPYSFKNHLSLTEDVDRFATEVTNAMISGNIDSPEGGFDALMQVITCTNQIGWRQKARHMIVFSTDADYHYAGDGKLAGIVEPNDELCHMENNEYTHGLLQDYPSIAQINNKAKENNMNIIFAVIDKVYNTYELLSQRIEGSNSGKLNKDSSNVVQFVQDQYARLVQGVTLTDDSSSNIQVRYFSTCVGLPEQETASCGNLRKGIVVDFTAEITVLQCPLEKELRNMRLEIKPQAINESLIVDIELDCDCPCERPGNQGFKPNARECSGTGNLQCGVCACAPGHVGRACECTAAAADLNVDDVSTCRAAETDPVCTARGDCKCGKCECTPRKDPSERTYGPYCECDNYNSCGKFNGMVCSGAEHGECDCGQCVCKPGWSGKNCECAESREACIKPGAKDVCSGRGECKCGACECQETGGQRYSGRFCEDCPTCQGQCLDLKSCVEMQVYQSDSLSEVEKARHDCNFFTLHIIESLDDRAIAEALMNVSGSLEYARKRRSLDELEQSDLEAPGGGQPTEIGESLPTPSLQVRPCSHADLVGCTFSFSYKYEGSILHVFATKNKDCGSEVNLLAVILGVILSILLAGLLLLIIWKVATTIHDRNEYAKFENERQNAKWDRGDNPLYVQATSTFSNPTFGAGASVRKSQLPD